VRGIGSFNYISSLSNVRVVSSLLGNFSTISATTINASNLFVNGVPVLTGVGGAVLIPNLTSSVQGLGSMNYLSSPFIIVKSVSSMQGNFSSLAVNCNFASYELDVNGTIRASGDVIAYSDRRVKENITPITQALEKIQQLQGVYYTRNDQEDKKRKIGFIAQEVEEVVPEVVITDSTEDNKKSIAYQNLTALLVEGIKEQQTHFTTTFTTLASEHSTMKSMFTQETSTLQGMFITLASEYSTLQATKV
jgi:hypothetical protein